MKESEKLILIVSHPDDECLFASSILDKISTLIICFNQIPGESNISIGRKRYLDNYPLKNFEMINLNLTQSKKKIIPNNWLNIKEKHSGLKGAYHDEYYDMNYELIINKLRSLIPLKSKLFTHNPWGEYGHSEHCQVFKAVFQIAKEKNSKLFVTNYISNLSINFAKTKFYLIGDEYIFLKTNLKLYFELKNFYLASGCWTWLKNYSPPIFECFYSINLNANQNVSSHNSYCTPPLNFISYRNPIYFYIRSLIKIFIPISLKNIFRNY